MADEKDEDLEFHPDEAGVAFKAEMAATNLLLGYWKHLVALLVVGLLAVLFYGQYQAWEQRTQRGLAGEIATAERDLPTNLIELPQAMQTGAEEVTPESLTSAAEQIEAVAEQGGGAAAVEAYLKAAELYRLAGAKAAQRAALEKAAGQAEGVLEYAAVSALANLDLEEGQGDQAVERLRALIARNEGYLGQQASIDLGMALEHLDRAAEAKQVYADFMQKWPDSPRAEEVRSRSSRLGGEG